MEIPLFNTLNQIEKNKYKTKQINLKNLNNLKLSNIDSNKFPLTKIIKKLPSKDSLYETVLVTINDELVRHFLNKKFSYSTLINKLFKLIHKKEFIKYKFIEPKKITDILKLNKLIKSKINY